MQIHVPNLAHTGKCIFEENYTRQLDIMYTITNQLNMQKQRCIGKCECIIVFQRATYQVLTHQLMTPLFCCFPTANKSKLICFCWLLVNKVPVPGLAAQLFAVHTLPTIFLDSDTCCVG